MDNDNPTNPYSSAEQQQIMRDVEESKRVAIEENDVSKQFYLNQLSNESD